MRKYILIILSVFAIIACNPRTKKKRTKSGPTHRFLTYNNTLFNSKDAFLTELENRKKAHIDNFYDPYISVYTTEDVLVENKDQLTPAQMEGAPTFRGKANNTNTQKKGLSTLGVTEAKALKTISKYSVIVNGVEKNKTIFDAYLLLAKARMLQGKYFEALDALNYIYNTMDQDKRVPLAKIYQAAIYTKLNEFQRADALFKDIDEDDKLKKSYRKILKVYQADNFLKWGKPELAVEVLEEAYQYNKDSKTRSRIAFLRGQILSKLGKKAEARESFTTAYKNANTYEFEVKSQIEIAKSFDGSADNYDEAIAYLEKIAKKGTYASRKNELFYAEGLVANAAKKTDEADAFFKKSLTEKQSDPQIRGLTYAEMAKNYFAKDDYLTAGVFYDSALAVMTYKPEIERLTALTANIKKISNNYYLIKKNDSILTLTKMSDDEKRNYFAKHIEKIKAKEAQVELEKKKAERSKGFDTGDYNTNPGFSSNTTLSNPFENVGKSGSSTFYFANTNNIPRGENSFKQTWGNRSLVDNWRYSAKTTSIEDLKTEALGLEKAGEPRRFEPDYYIEKIPTSTSEIASLKKARDTASLGIGRMYETFFSNTKLATKTLFDLVDNQPEEETDLQALYSIFVFNYEKNPSEAEKAKVLILEKYPYTSYAEFVANPKSKSFNKSTEQVEKLYVDAYKLYADEKFAESSALIEKAIQENPSDALIPKFYLLNAYNAGKTAGKEVMILQLEQILLNYEKTPEGIKAKQLLKHLQSDTKLEFTDENGNTISKTESAEKTQPANGKDRDRRRPVPTKTEPEED